jgi:ADP-ribosyl-[dinitrogen reductase] hydrolase
VLFELAVADAYGAGFELVPDELVTKHNDLTKYHHLSKYNKNPGRYTDDTQMSLAVTEAILTGDWFDERNYAKAFVDTFKRDPIRGYARGFGKLLAHVKSGDDLLKKILPASERGGAAMRAVPLGFLPKLRDVQFACTIQASITHRTSAGIRAALAVATASYFVAQKQVEPHKVVKLVEKSVPGQWDTWTGRVSLNGEEIASAALTAFSSSKTLSDILRKSVAFGGDTDTVAAIAVGIGSLSDHIKNDLPKALVLGLENGKFGANFLRQQDSRLRARFFK